MFPVMTPTYERTEVIQVTKVDELYRCSLCGNVVRVVKAGFGKLVCCGEPMDLITEDELEREE